VFFFFNKISKVCCSEAFKIGFSVKKKFCTYAGTPRRVQQNVAIEFVNEIEKKTLNVFYEKSYDPIYYVSTKYYQPVKMPQWVCLVRPLRLGHR